MGTICFFPDERNKLQNQFSNSKNFENLETDLNLSHEKEFSFKAKDLQEVF